VPLQPTIFFHHHCAWNAIARKVVSASQTIKKVNLIELHIKTDSQPFELFLDVEAIMDVFLASAGHSRLSQPQF
jgi:hypothetical protein